MGGATTRRRTPLFDTMRADSVISLTTWAWMAAAIGTLDLGFAFFINPDLTVSGGFTRTGAIALGALLAMPILAAARRRIRRLSGGRIVASTVAAWGGASLVLSGPFWFLYLIDGDGTTAPVIDSINAFVVVLLVGTIASTVSSRRATAREGLFASRFAEERLVSQRSVMQGAAASLEREIRSTVSAVSDQLEQIVLTLRSTVNSSLPADTMRLDIALEKLQPLGDTFVRKASHRISAIAPAGSVDTVIRALALTYPSLTTAVAADVDSATLRHPDIGHLIGRAAWLAVGTALEDEAPVPLSLECSVNDGVIELAVLGGNPSAHFGSPQLLELRARIGAAGGTIETDFVDSGAGSQWGTCSRARFGLRVRLPLGSHTVAAIDDPGQPDHRRLLASNLGLDSATSDSPGRDSPARDSPGRDLLGRAQPAGAGVISLAFDWTTVTAWFVPIMGALCLLSPANTLGVPGNLANLISATTFALLAVSFHLISSRDRRVASGRAIVAGALGTRIRALLAGAAGAVAIGAISAVTRAVALFWLADMDHVSWMSADVPVQAVVSLLVAAALSRISDDARMTRLLTTITSSHTRWLERELETSIAALDSRRNAVSLVLHSQVQTKLIIATALLHETIELWKRGEDLNAARNSAGEIMDIIETVVRVDLENLRAPRPVTSPLGVERELANLATALARTGGVQVRVRPGVTPVDPTIAHAVMSVCWEAVANAAIHGRARGITISLVEERGALELTVSNDGRPPERSRARNGLGSRIFASSLERWSLETGAAGTGAIFRGTLVMPPLSTPAVAVVDRPSSFAAVPSAAELATAS